MANPTVLSYKANPGTGPILIPAPGIGNTTVLLQHMLDAAGEDEYYTVAYVEGSKPTSTSVTLGSATQWWIQVNLPGGIATTLADIGKIFPITAATTTAGVTPLDDPPPPPGPIHGGHDI